MAFDLHINGTKCKGYPGHYLAVISKADNKKTDKQKIKQ